MGKRDAVTDSDRPPTVPPEFRNVGRTPPAATGTGSELGELARRAAAGEEVDVPEPEPRGSVIAD